VKKKRFSVEQIAAVLQQVRGGVPVADVCRQVGISEQNKSRRNASAKPPDFIGFGARIPNSRATGQSERFRPLHLPAYFTSTISIDT
jgi:transposase-like protein